MQKAIKRYGGKKFCQPTPSFILNLPGDRHVTLGILEKLKFRYDQKKEGGGGGGVGGGGYHA